MVVGRDSDGRKGRDSDGSKIGRKEMQSGSSPSLKVLAASHYIVIDRYC